ncbi:phospholipase/carboxylesterase [Sporosarcina sp. NCCP-2716]|uniref:alpha/beta hydrolase n=1 Tax=Sporosarcina sp. NCCP-2716 TaxID=2943679 RepID=UPI002041C149|nr:alpha/beta hydrolase [Sporosarcina sp. NCCP-2716]GKV70313.1 phospholipase/carboxylesterase [Sporosarcina sp. NCCP-2716]
MNHIFKQGAAPDKPVLLLLHGTGGTEHDLLGLAKIIDPEASVLSVRGNVLENGMPRFFKRLAEGVFDEKDLVFRTEELRDFIIEAAETCQFDARNLTAIGYSNGANIAASLLFHYADVLKAAILHHPMVPLRDVSMPDLTGVPVWIAAGTNDPICPAQEAEELQQRLDAAGASATVHWVDTGHQLTMEEVEAAKAWYEKICISINKQDN